ncbi:MAG TPA: glyoxalase superfamily protein [Kofleriaceae bacterium]
MVAISLTHDSAKEMAHRLRQFLAAGGISLKQTHAYEALAKSFGYRDWNTLLGALPSTGSASQDPVERGAAATGGSPSTPAMLLLIDRHAMAANGVTVTHIESAFRREFPGLLDSRSQWETLCHEQLPLRELPRFRPPVISVSLQTPEKGHFHDALMECMNAVPQPKWIFMEKAREGAHKLTFFFFPEQDVDALIPAMRDALARLPAEIALQAIEKIEPGTDHPVYGQWRSDGVPYFVWVWETDAGPLSRQLQLASIALRFNGEALVRLRDVATLHVSMHGAPRL